MRKLVYCDTNICKIDLGISINIQATITCLTVANNFIEYEKINLYEYIKKENQTQRLYI